MLLPNLGMETVHHVHAEDVAQSFIKAINNRSTAVGESFHVVSPQALTLKGYATAMLSGLAGNQSSGFFPGRNGRRPSVNRMQMPHGII